MLDEVSGFEVEEGKKDDNNKAPVRAGVINYFPNALLEIAKVSAFGAKKYSWGNWKFVENGKTRYGDAQMRHACLSHIESHDKESGLLHAAHEAWCALARLEIILIEMGAKDAD